MKKIVCLLFVLMICSTAVAETVYVSISDGSGQAVVAHMAVDAVDFDDDGTVTLCDALYAAHEAAYKGGAEAGFGSAVSDYGMSITRLWGVEQDSGYGYYVNDASAYSLADPINEGDSLYAYVYSDLEGWSDTYCYFQQAIIDASAGEEIALTLTMQSFDANWNPVEMPVEGAAITIDGKNCGMITDAEGNAAIVIDNPGEYLISASSEAVTLVPPVCIAKVK